MMDWHPVESAPYGKTLLVRNDLMDRPVRATRGYVFNGAVHPDQTFFTSVYTPDEFFPFPAGKLVCPTEWAELEATSGEWECPINNPECRSDCGAYGCGN